MTCTDAMYANFLHTSTNHLRLRRYQRAIVHHHHEDFERNPEWLLIETFFAMDRKRRDLLATAFPWLNMYHTTFI